MPDEAAWLPLPVSWPARSASSAFLALDWATCLLHLLNTKHGWGSCTLPVKLADVAAWTLAKSGS